MRTNHRLRLSFEQLEQRRLLACTGLGGTTAECFASDGPGTAESAWRRDLAAPSKIEGYTSESSYAPGEALELHVSTENAESYRIEIFRLGWYEGDGARLVGCLPDCTGGTLTGSQQPIPAPDPTTLMVDANWTVSEAFVVPNDWDSGYYIASLILASGPDVGEAHFVPFIVKAEATRNAEILVQVPVNTWQAYNSWGGHSLYEPAAADKVSFDRPYNNIDDVFRYEYQMLRYLEREGYDVEYATNVDVHRDPAMLLDHDLILSTGHDEYWTSETRDGFEAARDSGVNLGFFTSNAAYWQVRTEDDEQTLVGYKVKPPTINEDPEPDLSKKAMRFRELTPPRPECELIGVQYMGGHTSGFSTAESTYADYSAPDVSDPWFQNTGIDSTSTLDHRVGYEWDRIVAGCQSVAPSILFSYSDPDGDDAHATKYTANSGATVFATGSMGFSYGLDSWRYNGTAVEPADPRMQQFVRNVLDDLTTADRPPFEQSSTAAGLVDIEAELFHANTPQGISNWTEIVDPDASSGTAMISGPEYGINRSTNYESTSPRLDYEIEFTETGVHYVWLAGKAGGATVGSSDSVHVGLDNVAVATGQRIQGFSEVYGWSTNLSNGLRATIDVATPGLHTFNVWMREDAFVLDRIVLTTDPNASIESLTTVGSFQQTSDGNGLVDIEAEQFDLNTAAGISSWSAVSEVEASAGAGMLAGPEYGINRSTGYEQSSPRLDYEVNFVESGIHYIWILGRAAGATIASSDSVHAGIDGVATSSAQRIQGFSDQFGWSGSISTGDRATIDVPSTGLHTLNLWMREDAFLVDRIVLTTNPTPDIESLFGATQLTPSFQQSAAGDGIVDIEAESFDLDAARSGHAWNLTSDAQASSGETMVAGPETGMNASSNYAATSPRLDYYIDFVETGVHYLWVLGRAAGAVVGSSDTVHAGLDGNEVPTLRRIQSFSDEFGWSNDRPSNGRATFTIAAPGVHTLNIWMREDAFSLDRIFITTNPTTDIASILPQASASFASLATPPVAMDVNGDSHISPLDALLIINHLNASAASTSDALPPLSKTFRLDTNSDGAISPIDALQVINYLNDSTRPAEGERDSLNPEALQDALDAALASLYSERKRKP